jgi:hypothetical protein
MFETDDVFRAAQEIREHLRQLIGADQPAVDARLARLLERAAAGQDVKLEVLELLAEREATREWASRRLGAHEWFRSYPTERPPAAPGPIPVRRYACPQRCDFVWYRFSKADTPPPCPRHGIALAQQPLSPKE